jgi:hypothetical protein
MGEGAPTFAVSPWNEALATLHDRYGDQPVILRRSREGRRLSRFRYHNAEAFFSSLEAGFDRQRDNLLYHSGIVAQLALSAHLLDVGFDDSWCARHIGHRVAHSLAYANATGLGHDCPDMACLADILTPYWKWNRPRILEERAPDDGPFSADDIRRLLRALLEHIHDVTGHPRPSGWRRVSPQAPRRRNA